MSSKRPSSSACILGREPYIMAESQKRSTEGSSSPRKRPRLEEDESSQLDVTDRTEGAETGAQSEHTRGHAMEVSDDLLSQDQATTKPKAESSTSSVASAGELAAEATTDNPIAVVLEGKASLGKRDADTGIEIVHDSEYVVENGAKDEEASQGDVSTSVEADEQALATDGRSCIEDKGSAEAMDGLEVKAESTSQDLVEQTGEVEERGRQEDATPKAQRSQSPTSLAHHSPVALEDEGEPELELQGEGEVENTDGQTTAVGSPAPSSARAPSISATPVPSKPKKGKAKTTKAKTGKPGKGNKVDKLKASAATKKAIKERSVSESATPAPTADSYDHSTPGPDHRDSSPVDNSVYCICKKAYDDEDEDTVMIGCDRCDNWFHPACVNIAEDQLDMIDLFVCIDCEQRTSDRTIFKVKCRRPDCRRTTLSSASKYCSEACGMHHALAKLRAKKLLFDDVYPAIDYAAQPEPVHVLKLETRIVSPQPGSRPDDLDVLLEQIAQQEEAIAQARRIIEARREMLQQAIVNAEALLPAPVVAEDSTETSGGKKNKKPKKAAAVDLRACGYDSRLASDDAEVLAMLKAEGDAAQGEVCPASRRCDRHLGWQKTIAVELEVEMALNARRSDQLASQSLRIKSGLERKAKAKVISAAFRAARSAPIEVDS